MLLRCTLPHITEGARLAIGSTVHTVGPHGVLLPQPENATDLVARRPTAYEWTTDPVAMAAVEAQRVAAAEAADPRLVVIRLMRGLSDADIQSVLAEFTVTPELEPEPAPTADPFTTPAVGSAPAASADGYRPRRHKGAR